MTSLNREYMEKIFNTSLKTRREFVPRLLVDEDPQDLALIAKRLKRTSQNQSSEPTQSRAPKRPLLKDRLNEPSNRLQSLASRVASKNSNINRHNGYLLSDEGVKDEQDVEDEPSNASSRDRHRGEKVHVEETPITRTQRNLPRNRKQRLSDFIVPDEPPQPLGYSKTHGLGEPWKKPLVYPFDGKKKSTVEWSDLEKLDEGEYLNDNLLGFYLRFLEHEHESKSEALKNVYWFNTYFFTSLTQNVRGKGKINYDAVRKWTRSVDLFRFDYVIVPINENHHWYLAIICNLPALKRATMPLADDDDDMLDKENASDAEEVKEPAERDVHESITDVGLENEGDPPRREADPNEQLTRESFAEMQLDDAKKDPPSIVAIDADDAPSPTCESKEYITQDEVLEIINAKDSKGTRLLEIADKKVEASPKPGKGKRKPKFDPDYPTIMTLDSLSLPHPVTIKILKLYLQEEANDKRGGMSWDDKAIRGMTAQEIPRQQNYWDCGLYVLGYAARFMMNPREFVVKMCTREFDIAKDWPALEPSNMRSSTRDLIFSLHREQYPHFYTKSDVASAPVKQEVRTLILSRKIEEKDAAKGAEVKEPSTVAKVGEASKKVRGEEQPQQIGVEERSGKPRVAKHVKTAEETCSGMIRASPDPPVAAKVRNGKAASQAISIDDSASEMAQLMPIEEAKQIPSPRKVPGAFDDSAVEDDEDSHTVMVPDSQEG